jgi:hypothetical protein
MVDVVDAYDVDTQTQTTKKDKRAQMKQKQKNMDRKVTHKHTHARTHAPVWYDFLLRISSGALLLLVASLLSGLLQLRRVPRSVNHVIRLCKSIDDAKVHG